LKGVQSKITNKFLQVKCQITLNPVLPGHVSENNLRTSLIIMQDKQTFTF